METVLLSLPELYCVAKSQPNVCCVYTRANKIKRSQLLFYSEAVSAVNSSKVSCCACCKKVM